jgi:hypothetical protein
VTIRRIKSYSAPTGYVYQYHFEEIRPGQRHGGREGSEYVYIVSRDRKQSFPLSIFLPQAAREGWERAHGRALTGTETYAAAKMRLFRAFDELEDLEGERLKIELTPQSLEELLAELDID